MGAIVVVETMRVMTMIAMMMNGSMKEKITRKNTKEIFISMLLAMINDDCDDNSDVDSPMENMDQQPAQVRQDDGPTKEGGQVENDSNVEGGQ